ncbi:MAG: DUF512 domain-containing protein [Coriobacteriales bacterium]|jgi:putative radical SAM enzyme (TIGR03279 family)|nr:DUF512 domain-containing protein [Coriobacteriales bacterium]
MTAKTHDSNLPEYDGSTLHDVLDAMWISDGELGASDFDEYDGPLFDGIHKCKNKCIFCFVDMMPKGMRRSLYIKDDDFRLSFLQGNFITLTNITDDELDRIIAQRLTPLHVSLHAVGPKIRERMMGRNQERGTYVLKRLLESDIEVHTQIVLMPGVNDGAELDATLSWVCDEPGILSCGIVPYGYTRYASVQGSYDTPESCLAVINQVEAFKGERGVDHIYLADEFFLGAYPQGPIDHIPPAGYYGTYPQYENGIGMVRSFIDDYPGNHAAAFSDASVIITGELMAPVLRALCGKQVCAIRNDFFGGNVSVAGLLVASDIVKQVRAAICAGEIAKDAVFALPPAMFNEDGLTLDGKTAREILKAIRE